MQDLSPHFCFSLAVGFCSRNSTQPWPATPPGWVAAAECVDADQGAADNSGFGCAEYHPPWDEYCSDPYGLMDNEIFTSATMCCACGGGIDPRRPMELYGESPEECLGSCADLLGCSAALRSPPPHPLPPSLALPHRPKLPPRSRSLPRAPLPPSSFS